MGLRLAGIAIGAQYGVTQAVIGVVVPSADDGLDPRDRPRGPAPVSAAAPVPLGDDRRPIIRFVIQSAAYTGLISVRTWIAPLTLGIVRSSAHQSGLFRGRPAPDNGLARLLAAADDPAQRADPRLGARPARGGDAGDSPLRRGVGGGAALALCRRGAHPVADPDPRRADYCGRCRPRG